MMKGKIARALLLLTLLILIAFLVAAIARPVSRPLDSYITTDGLMTAAEEVDYILVKANDGYFELQGTAEFAALFKFSLWQQQGKEPSGEPILILRFAETWIVEFFPDGTVAAHNGYVSRGTKSDAYYTIPLNTADVLIFYIKAHGVEHKFGDGTIGDTTFHK